MGRAWVRRLHYIFATAKQNHPPPLLRSAVFARIQNAERIFYAISNCFTDVVVICDEPQYLDEHRDVVTNPKIIIEVLSPTTEAFDRGEKFDRYDFWNPTLSDYLLVSQDQPRVEHFIRQDDGNWTRIVYRGLKSKAALKSIGCSLKLADVYDRVQFAAQ